MPGGALDLSAPGALSWMPLPALPALFCRIWHLLPLAWGGEGWNHTLQPLLGESGYYDPDLVVLRGVNLVKQGDTTCSQGTRGPVAAILPQSRPRLSFLEEAFAREVSGPEGESGLLQGLQAKRSITSALVPLGRDPRLLAIIGWGIGDILAQTPRVQWPQGKCHH